MTSGSGKLWRSLILRSIGAVLAGSGVVAAFVVLLSLYGAPQENIPMVTAQTLKFPENEKMLNDATARLAREGAALSTIEPAAGEKKSSAAR